MHFLTRLLPGLFAIAWMLPMAWAQDTAQYTLKKGDMVRMSVFQEDELATEVQIGKSGSVSFPLIGSVSLVGLTIEKAEQVIKQCYEKDYLVNARVNVSVVSYVQKWVIVGGEVRSPGTIVMPEDGSLDLRGVIAQAGGVTEAADISNIVARTRGGRSRTVHLEHSGGMLLGHGDSITVRRSSLDRSTVTMSGQIASPGIVEFPKAGTLDIVTAIAQAGGFTRLANTKEVLVRRGNAQQVVNLRNIERGESKMFYLKAGDLVTIQESRW